MEEGIWLYDIYDDSKKIINSQVILNNNIGFEIPKDYFFAKNHTNLKERILRLDNGKRTIKLYYEKCYEKDYNKKIEELKGKYKITEDFTNYRNQKIIEYETETGINIICYDGSIVLMLNSRCQKYSNDYYVLYFIAYSFDSNCGTLYENYYYQKNSYCILKNAYHIYKKYKINLIKYNPSEILAIINRKNFCKYISNISDFDYEIDNHYMAKDIVFEDIVNKIEKYNNLDFNDNPSFIDLIE